MHFTVSDAGNGLYRWVLCDGPTISRCLTEITAAREALTSHFDADPDPLLHPTHPSTDPQIPHRQTPHGQVIPLYQDIPAADTHGTPSTSF